MYVSAIGLGLIVTTASVWLLAYARHNDLPKRFRFSAIALATAGMLLILFSICGGICHMVYGRCAHNGSMCASAQTQCQSMSSCHHGGGGSMNCMHGKKCGSMSSCQHGEGGSMNCMHGKKCGSMDQGKCMGKKKMMCKKMSKHGDGEDVDVTVEINNEDTVVTTNH